VRKSEEARYGEREAFELQRAEVDLSTLSDGDLLDLAVPVQTLKRRTLIMWLYLKFRPQGSLDKLDVQLALEAEEELKKRASRIKKNPAL
jgi:hypothetical protein